MFSPKRNLLSAAVLLALAASPAHAVLERVGPIDKAPGVGGFPAWFQDKSGVTLEFCALTTTQERDGGWCTLLAGSVPEVFPVAYGNEHFYYAATNDMRDAGTDFRARLVVALEGAFANNVVNDGDQVTFGRLRVVIANLPWDGDYRVITPYSDTTYVNQKAGGKIAVTSDIGLGCVATFECTLKTAIGPFLLPSPVAGGNEVPPMPDLKSAPPGTDPFYDALVALGGATGDPQTGKQYLADPKRIGPVTGSSLPNFIDSTGASRNHNTFRVEVRQPSATHDGPVFYTMEGENNFIVGGRLLAGTLPGKVTPARATYKADGVGNMTDLDVFATASPTTQARLPAQPLQPPALPVLSFYDAPCTGALTVVAETGLTMVNPPPYSAPAGTPVSMAQQGNTFWAQTQPTIAVPPPSHVCIVDSSARDAGGQTVPAYSLQQVSDKIAISAAGYDGPSSGTLTVNATSSDPTAVLTLTGYGPAQPGTPGVATASAAGTGLDLAGNAATVSGLMAAPANVQVVSSRGGIASLATETVRGMPAAGGGGAGGSGGGGTAPPVIGVPVAVNDSATMFEDCSPAAASICAAGQALAVDLIGNDTVLVDGTVTTLRNFVRQGLGTVTVSAAPPRLGLASLTPDGIVSYLPNPNANGSDSMTYTVTVNGQVSNQAILSITITPVNDPPFAGDTTSGAVLGKANTLNLLAASTDPDGFADLKDAVIVSWPAQLGAQSTPINGVVTYTPIATGTYNIVYQVRDAAGAVSPNTATGSVTVLSGETITFTKSNFTPASLRWTVSGTDSVHEGQTMTILYADGKTRSGVLCDGISTSISCMLGTAVVDGAGNWLLDRIVPATGPLNPTDTTTWSKSPSRVKVYSSAPALGGAATASIVTK